MAASLGHSNDGPQLDSGGPTAGLLRECESLRELATRLPRSDRASVVRLIDTAATRLHRLGDVTPPRAHTGVIEELDEIQTALALVRVMLEGRVGPRSRTASRRTGAIEMKTDSWRDDLTAEELEAIDGFDDLDNDDFGTADDDWDDWQREVQGIREDVKSDGDGDDLEDYLDYANSKRRGRFRQCF